MGFFFLGGGGCWECWIGSCCCGEVVCGEVVCGVCKGTKVILLSYNSTWEALQDLHLQLHEVETYQNGVQLVDQPWQVSAGFLWLYIVSVTCLARRSLDTSEDQRLQGSVTRKGVTSLEMLL